MHSGFKSSCVRRTGCAVEAFNSAYYASFDPLHLSQAVSSPPRRGGGLLADPDQRTFFAGPDFTLQGLSSAKRTITVTNFDARKARLTRNISGPRTLTPILLSIVLELLNIPAFSGVHRYFGNARQCDVDETSLVMRTEADTLSRVLIALRQVIDNVKARLTAVSESDASGRSFIDFDEHYGDFAEILDEGTLDFYSDYLRTLTALARQENLSVNDADFHSPLLFPEFSRIGVMNLQELIDVAKIRREAKSIVGNGYILDDIKKLTAESKQVSDMMRDISRFHKQMINKHKTTSTDLKNLPHNQIFELRMGSLKRELQASAGELTKRRTDLHNRLAKGKHGARLVSLYAQQRLSWPGKRFLFVNESLSQAAIDKFWSEYTVQFLRESPTYNELSFTAEQKKTRDCVKILRRTIAADVAELSGGCAPRGESLSRYLPWLDRDQVSMDFCEGFIMLRMPRDAATGASPRRISCDPVAINVYPLQGAAVGSVESSNDVEGSISHIVLESTTTETWEILPMDLFDLMPAYDKLQLLIELEAIIRQRQDTWEQDAIGLVMDEPEILQPYARKTVSALVGTRVESADEWMLRLRKEITALRDSIAVHCISLRVNSYAVLTYRQGEPPNQDRIICMREVSILHQTHTKTFSLNAGRS